jgi:glycine/D-amino acid oxidase-like deaminating enzyme
MADVIVVGAGIIGAAIARAAAERGASVDVVEADRPGGGTTLGTFAWVNAVGKQPRGYFDLNVAGMAEHRRLVDALGGGEWYHPGGNLEWSTTRTDVRARVEHHAAWGYPAKVLDPGAAREFEPAAAIGDDAVAAFYPDDAWIDPVVLVGRLLRHPRVVTTIGAAVQGVSTSASRAIGVTLNDGRELAADHVVLATGPDAAALLAPLGCDIPMRHAPGLLVLTEPAPTGVARVLHAPRVAIRPDGAGRLLLAADDLDKRLEPAGGDLGVTDASEELLSRARAAVPGLAGVRVEALRLGRRALAADGFPAVGTVPGIDGAYLAVTHSGVTLAPLLGRLAAAEILEATTVPQLADYRPQRFAANP